MNQFSDITDISNPFRADLFINKLSLTYAVIWVVCVIALLLGIRVIAQLRKKEKARIPVKTKDYITDGQSAVVTIEFALVFPILLFMMLLLTQTTLLMGGNLFVHYAAFAATRSAIVQIPTNYTNQKYNQLGEQANVYTHTQENPKYDAIHRAAVIAVLPISGQSNQSLTSAPAQQLVTAFSHYFAGYGYTEPNWVESLIAERLQYAVEHTLITLYRTEVVGDVVEFQPVTGISEVFEPREPITVQVTHNFNLSIPWAHLIFEDSDSRMDDTTPPYTVISAAYTLTNEGISDIMPPLPNIPRWIYP